VCAAESRLEELKRSIRAEISHRSGGGGGKEVEKEVEWRAWNEALPELLDASRAHSVYCVVEAFCSYVDGMTGVRMYVYVYKYMCYTM